MAATRENPGIAKGNPMRNMRTAGRILLVLAASLWAVASPAEGIGNRAQEQTFDLLTIGTSTYTNVTVTSKTKDSIFIEHSKGMQNIKVASLSPEVRQQLGFEPPPVPKLQQTVAWAKAVPAKVNVQALEEKAKILFPSQADNSDRAAQVIQSLVGMISVKFIVAVLVGICLLHLSYSFCCRLICLKAGSEPGVMVWLPVVQVFPMLRAAGMSGWWFLGLLVPILNIVASILWCWNIAKARGKGPVVAILLLFPPTSLLTFLFLAFADSIPEKEDRRVEVMTLETA
jgi:hypothetical protein